MLNMAKKKTTSKKTTSKKTSKNKKTSTKKTTKKTSNKKKKSTKGKVYKLQSGSVVSAKQTHRKPGVPPKTTTSKKNVSHYKMDYLYIGGILFPVTPKKITYTVNNKNETIDLINEGEVNLLKKAGLIDIEIQDILLPNQNYPFANYVKEFHPAYYYLDKLAKWKQSKKPVKFVFSRVDIGNSNKLAKDTNMMVSIEDYTFYDDAENYGLDMGVDIKMKQYKSWGAKTLKIIKKKSKKHAKKSKSRSRSTKKVPKTYKLKSGDTLKKIAKRYLGSSSEWTTLYSKNKNTIEKAAKKHGRRSSSKGIYIYAGTVIKI